MTDPRPRSADAVSTAELGSTTVELAQLDDAGLLVDGRRVAVGPAGVTLGRSGDADVVIDSSSASREHARVEPHDGGYRVVDLGSKNGTRLEGRRIEGAAPLASGDAIEIAGQVLRFVWGRATRVAQAHLPVVGTQKLQMSGDRMTIGRDHVCDLVLDDPNVSRLHAELRREGDVLRVVDLGSTNGVYVGGKLTASAEVASGEEVSIGPYRLLVEGSQVIARDERGTLRLRASELVKRVGRRTILAPTSLELEPGRFVAILGESGAGKSTLLRILAGVDGATAGTVAVNGDDLSLHRTSIGYVPQVEALHGKLTVREALRYAARLRLPEDAAATDIDAACERVTEELELAEHVDTWVENLSGGQRRRVGVGLELLTRPSLVFLDEPTTGLDPGLERRMMRLLAGLADSTRTVVLVTHATASLATCDEVVVMGRGGHLVFQGTPADALTFFEVESFDEIYDALGDRPVAEWQRKRAEGLSDPHPEPEPKPAQTGAAAVPRRALWPQAATLAARYLRHFVRDRRNGLILLGQVPLFGLALVGLFDRAALAPSGNPNDAAQFLFLLITVAVWIGSIDAAREIVKERAVLSREADVGVRIDAYVLSKVLVLWALVAVQVGLLATIVLALRPLESTTGDAVLLVAILLVTGFVSVAMGLAVSAAARSQDQATSFVPLVLIPQLFFAGAIIPQEQMTAPIRALSELVFAKWSYAISGAPVDLHERLAGRTVYGAFFDASPYVGFAVLALFAAVLLGIARFQLERRSARR